MITSTLYLSLYGAKNFLLYIAIRAVKDLIKTYFLFRWSNTRDSNSHNYYPTVGCYLNICASRYSPKDSNLYLISHPFYGLFNARIITIPIKVKTYCHIHYSLRLSSFVYVFCCVCNAIILGEHIISYSSAL